MSPILKRDLCFIAKYFAVGLMVSVGIAYTVLSEKHIPYHAIAAPPSSTSEVPLNDAVYVVPNSRFDIQTVRYTNPH